MTERKQGVVDLVRAKGCLAAFSDAWDSSDIYILAAPVNEKGAINIGHPYVRTNDMPEGFDPDELIGGNFLHLGGTGSLKLNNKSYSALLWDGGIQGGGLQIGGEWEEGNTWAELAKKSGAELLRGNYGVSVTGGSPIALWAIVVVAELWEADWRKPAPGENHFLFPAYTASIETWKRIIRKCEQEALTDDGNGEKSIAVPAAIGAGLTGLLSWLIYRRNKVQRNESTNIGLRNQDSVTLPVRQNIRLVWQDPVWSKVIAAGILGILGIVASYVFGWFG